jgi:hypothetical protein
MTIERVIRIMAGFFVLLSLASAGKAARSSFRSGSWPSAFVGLNLLQSGFTGFARRKNCSPKWVSSAATAARVAVEQ